MQRKNEREVSERRGFLRVLGLGTAAAASVTMEAAAQRADAVPPGTARKESEAQRLAGRYQPNAADVQAFYRTNRYEY